ncbi:MAG: hypothetical protein M3Y03_00075 [Verrucomicrobiota bacterium]|nr:hypothetical protein [Verrucomicrobiota bacterium]
MLTERRDLSALLELVGAPENVPQAFDHAGAIGPRQLWQTLRHHNK